MLNRSVPATKTWTRQERFVIQSNSNSLDETHSWSWRVDLSQWKCKCKQLMQSFMSETSEIVIHFRRTPCFVSFNTFLSFPKFFFSFPKIIIKTRLYRENMCIFVFLFGHLIQSRGKKYRSTKVQKKEGKEVWSRLIKRRCPDLCFLHKCQLMLFPVNRNKNASHVFCALWALQMLPLSWFRHF